MTNEQVLLEHVVLPTMQRSEYVTHSVVLKLLHGVVTGPHDPGVEHETQVDDVALYSQAGLAEHVVTEYEYHEHGTE